MSENEDFGLRNVQYEPVDRGQKTSGASATARPNREEPEKSKLPLILLGLLVVLLGIGAYWYFMVKPESDLKKEQMALAKEEDSKRIADAVAKKVEIDRLEEERIQAETAQANEEAAASSIPEIGTITVLSSKTGRSYVVVGSFFDRDQAMDYGNKIAKKGVNSFVLEPVGKVKFYRLSVADFDTYSEASNNVGSFQGEYGDQIWVLKY